jgi:hypothetical protein
LPVYWTLAFAPFQLDPQRFAPNRLERLAGAGVRFEAPSLLRTRTPPSWLTEVARGAPLRIDLEVRSRTSPQRGPARILTISDGFYRRNLTLAQEGSDLVVRLRRPASDANGKPPFLVRNVFARPEWRRLVLEIRDATLRIEVDGAVEVRDELGSLRSWDPSYPLALGDEVVGSRGWRGELRRVQVRAGESTIDYLEPGILDAPRGWGYLWIRLPGLMGDESRWWTPRERIANVLAFLPLGWIVWASMRSRRMVKAVGLCAAVSLTMEVGQVFFRWRHPSIPDLVLNTVGGAIGALWAALLARFGRTPGGPGPPSAGDRSRQSSASPGGAGARARTRPPVFRGGSLDEHLER